jgi:competence protein ComEA
MIDNIKKKFWELIKKHGRVIFIVICTILTFAIILVLIFKKFDKVKAEENHVQELNITQEEKEEIKEEKKIIRVDIKGAVSKPGVYSLEEGSIVDDAIKLAGGVNKNANTKEINLSKKLKDEMVIVIYTNSEIQEFKDKQTKVTEKECICDQDINDVCVKESYTNYYSFNSGSQISISKQESVITGLININTASLEELLSLPGIGESKAKAIIEYRKENRFEVIEDIMKVSGIGQSVFDKIKENITV